MFEHFAPSSRLSSGLSTLVVNGFAGVALFLWVSVLLFLVLRCRREAAKLNRPPNGEPDTSDGSVILYGSVDPTPQESPSAPVIAVTIEQSGSITKRLGEARMHWVETHRKETVHHFDLLLPSGVRVRVKPGTTVSLRRRLDTVAGAAPTRRRRSAKVMRGAKVYVMGTFGPQGAAAGALRPLNGSLIAVSDEPFGARSARRMVHHMKFAALAVLSLGVIHLGLASEFHTLRDRGDVVTVRVADLRPGGPWLVTGFPAGLHRAVTDETNAAVFSSLHIGSEVPFTCDPREGGACQIGHREVGVSWALALVIVAALAAQAVIHVLLARRALFWDERRTLNESEAWFGEASSRS